ncbi:uncharacterized protein LOC127465775 [Manacus candei]|uniref:uncharacterized protein LOC127465775 n=1 Tax=Manacus candei TaxID=415023 RepID=UPI0022267361|nr:uncharacterized protein LOC127465775 [Manacus candei]
MAAPTLEQLLTELLEPQNPGIRRATARLKEALEEPRAGEELAALLRGADRPQVRQFSAVLLRRLLKRLRPELIQRLPTLLVEALEEEPDPPVRLSLVHLGAQLLPRAGPRIWAPLGRWVEEAAAGGDPRRKEGALQLLGVAVGVAPALVGVSRSPAHLLGLLRGGLRAGNSPGILQKGLRALGGVVGALPGGGPKSQIGDF